MNKKIEVIMAAYNQVENTRLVLDGYLNQTKKDFSICIADDGSGPEIKKLVDEYLVLGLNIRHVWHEDKGFRRARIINKAINSSKAEYIVLTDNDCIPSKYFIKDYCEVLNNSTLFLGRRVDLCLSLTDKIKSRALSLNRLESPVFLLLQSMKKGLKRPEMAIRFPKWICSIWNRKPRKALGANMAVARDALLSVNGFDNDFEGYGFEECDLERRLNLSGIKSQTVLGRCALFHLYHPEKSESNDAVQMFKRKANEGRVVCLNGIKDLTRHSNSIE